MVWLEEACSGVCNSARSAEAGAEKTEAERQAGVFLWLRGAVDLPSWVRHRALAPGKWGRLPAPGTVGDASGGKREISSVNTTMFLMNLWLYEAAWRVGGTVRQGGHQGVVKRVKCGVG